MENIVSFYGTCPVCGQKSLHKYQNSNIPVVDLVCTNLRYHLVEDKCFIFQLKISLTTDYFNKGKQIIAVGSKIFGEPSHLVSVKAEIENKIVVPGYICIKLYRDRDNIQTYHIDKNNSFVIVPKYSVPNYQNKSDNNYYRYLDSTNKYGKHIISWNNFICDLYDIDIVINLQTITFEVFNEEVIQNPYNKLNILLQ